MGPGAEAEDRANGTAGAEAEDRAKGEDQVKGEDHKGSAGDPRDDRGRLNLTDPKAIRALAHPVRGPCSRPLDRPGP